MGKGHRHERDETFRSFTVDAVPDERLDHLVVSVNGRTRKGSPNEHID